MGIHSVLTTGYPVAEKKVTLDSFSAVRVNYEQFIAWLPRYGEPVFLLLFRAPAIVGKALGLLCFLLSCWLFRAWALEWASLPFGA